LVSQAVGTLASVTIIDSSSPKDMGYPITPPPYPVVEREPTVSQLFAAFRRGDWVNVALATGVSAPFGYYAGKPVLMVRSMWFATSIGMLGGVFIGLQQSFGRLTGYKANGEELAKLGRRFPDQLKEEASDVA
jgi:NADH-ubiquinone oxidoreductase complex I, 21 kDa subunit